MKVAFILCLLLAATVYAQPYEPHVIWDRSGLQDSSSYGYTLLPLGDQNDDGFTDWAVLGAGNGHQQRSYLEFFHGAPTLPSEPYHTYYSDTSIYLSGFGAMAVGDMNGDGHVDWIVELGRRPNGALYDIGLFFGGPNAVDTPQVVFHTYYRRAPEAAGDFNGDGYADLRFWDSASDTLSLYYGGTSIDTVQDWVLHVPPPGIQQTVPYAFGDFNGDGASDFMLYSPGSGNIAIFLGGTDPDTVPAYQWTLPNRAPLGGVRSLNGDIYDEIIFGSTGSVAINYGAPILSPETSTWVNFSCTYTLHATSAGDFNHDGYDDLLMWNDQCDGNMFGALTLHLGHPWLNPDPVLTIEGDWPDGLIGIHTAVGLGDINGDSLDDFAIGAWDDFAYLGWRGRCVITSGDSLRVSADEPRAVVPRELTVTTFPNPFNSETTIRLQLPPSPDPITLTIYNVLGQNIRQETLPAFTGEYNYHFDGQHLVTGLYIVHAESGKLHATQKLILLQ